MDILSRKTCVLESRFLQASAGTGKTFAIEQLIARLILEGFKVEQILAVTFTRMAAREMKRRVRANLERLLTGDSSPDYLLAMQEEGRGFEAKEYLREALVCFDQTELFTIHGFCQKMLSQYAFEAGLGFERQEKGASALMKEVIFEFLRTELSDPEQAEELLKECRQNFDTLLQQMMFAMNQPKSVSPLLSSLGQRCRGLWIERCRSLDLLTPDGLLQTMEQAILRPAFVENIRSRYRALIIDEFQDTDPLSWKIFSTLFLEGEPKIVYLVGDPKQSIYGFRSADLGTYLAAGEIFGKEKHAYLTTNFRSSPKLVEALNALFSRSDWIDLATLPGTLTYLPVEAGRVPSDQQEENPICFFIAQAEATRERSWPSKQLEREVLFPYIAKEACQLHDSSQIPFSKMAILVKDRFQAGRLQEFLEERLIPSAIRQVLHLAKERGFAAFEDLLRATLKPEDRGAKIKAQLSVGKELDFHDLHELLFEKGFPYFYHELIEKDVLREATIRQTAEILLETSCPPAHLLQIMEELKSTDPEEDPRLKVRGAESTDRIEILTLFASKGLEFEVVFALGLSSRHLSEENSEQEEEKMRQLYVALTRAREKLYIPLLLPPLKQKPKVLSPLELFWKKRFGKEIEVGSLEGLAGICTVEVGREDLGPYERAEDKMAPQAEEQEPLLPSFQKIFITSFSSLSQKIAPSSPKESTPNQLPLGVETGTVIHTVLERLFETGLHSYRDPLGFRALVEKHLASTSLQSWQQEVEEMIITTLHTPLWEGFSLKDLSPDEVVTELEFLYPEGERLIKGFIDLLFRYKGKYYVLDWKTNLVESSASAEECMRENDYFLQAALYTEAAKRYVKLFDNAPVAGALYVFLRGPYVVFT